MEELIEENKKLKELVNTLEEEHATTFQQWVNDLKDIKKQHERYTKAMEIIETMITDLKELNNED